MSVGSRLFVLHHLCSNFEQRQDLFFPLEAFAHSKAVAAPGHPHNPAQSPLQYD